MYAGLKVETQTRIAVALTEAVNYPASNESLSSIALFTRIRIRTWRIAAKKFNVPRKAESVQYSSFADLLGVNDNNLSLSKTRLFIILKNRVLF
jgi:hypothetical protein